MTKRILSILVAISLMFALASIGMAKSSSDDIIVSATKEMIFDKKITDSCHASTVLPLDDGSVIAAWFGGSSEKENDVKIYTSVRTEEEGWSDPIVVSAADDIAHWNPVLFQKEDGTVVLYFKVGADTDYWQTYYATSTDGRSWSTPRELIPGVRTPLVLSVSTDDGQTFTKIKTFEKGLAEYSYPAVVVKGDTIHITYTYERDYIAYWQIKIK